MTFEYLWLFAITGGVVLLGMALIYGSLKSRTLHPDEKKALKERLRDVDENEDHAA
jgi:hypothetical protein